MSIPSQPADGDPQRGGEPGATRPRDLEDAEQDVPEPTEEPSGDPDRPSNPS